jgi:hypothetical protein
MQLLYTFYFYKPGQPPEDAARFDLKALHLFRCPLGISPPPTT